MRAKRIENSFFLKKTAVEYKLINMGTYNCPIKKMFCRVQHSPNNFNKKNSLRYSESNLKSKHKNLIKLL